MKTLLLAATLALSGGAFAAPATYDELTQSAQTQLAAREVVAAQKSIEAAIELAQTPAEKSEALLTLGAILGEQKLYERARETYQQIVPLVKDAPAELYMTRLLIASTYAEQELWAQAIDAWTQIVDEAPAPELKNAVRLELASAYTKINQPDKAHQQMEILRQSLAPIIADATAPPDARGLALITLGRSYQSENNLDAARQSLESATEIAGLSGELMVNALKSLGEIAQQQGRDADEKVAFGRARNLLQKQAFALFQEQQWDEAIDDYREALTIGVPTAFEELLIHWQTALALQRQGAPDDARAEFERVIASAPATSNDLEESLVKNIQPIAYLEIAKSDIAAQKLESARATLDKLRQYPGLQTVFSQQAEALLKSLPPAPQ